MLPVQQRALEFLKKAAGSVSTKRLGSGHNATIPAPSPDTLGATAEAPPWLDYPVRPEPRWGYGKPPHRGLYEILDGNRSSYRSVLEEVLAFSDNFAHIPLEWPSDPSGPYWSNGYLAGLDAVSLYSLLATTNPATYLEIGSGHSTRFARRAVSEQGLQTKIISIDPSPRSEIDKICDSMLRCGLEDVDLSIFSALGPGDVFFLDGSHRCFTNSDVTVAFLEVFPMLPPGVLIHIHDITLPDDYPSQWSDRYYSEQYLLAVQLLTNPDRFEIVLPNYFVTMDAELSQVLDSLWSKPEMSGVGAHGVSFWYRDRG